jgi:hypothetical protein
MLQHELKLMVQAGEIGRQGQRKHTVYLFTTYSQKPGESGGICS